MNDLSISQSVHEVSGLLLADDQTTLDAKLDVLKALKYDGAAVTIYVVEISKINKNLRCKRAKQLQCNKELLTRFQGYVEKCIEDRNHISNFSEITTNPDNRFFHLETSETDFLQIVDTLHPPQQSEDVGTVTKMDELQKFNAYVIEIYLGKDTEALYGFRYVSEAWSPKNSAVGFFKMNNDMVAMVDDSAIFRIDQYLDFIVYGEDLFVADCSRFESAMQFKDRLLDRKGEAIVEMKNCSIFVAGNEETLNVAIGTDRHFLRQLSSVKSKGFYKDQVWVGKLQQVAKAAGNWLLEFDAAGKIIIKNDKQYVRELLTVLQNKRVETVVDKKICDVDGELTAQVTR